MLVVDGPQSDETRLVGIVDVLRHNKRKAELTVNDAVDAIVYGLGAVGILKSLIVLVPSRIMAASDCLAAVVHNHSNVTIETGHILHMSLHCGKSSSLKAYLLSSTSKTHTTYRIDHNLGSR